MIGWDDHLPVDYCYQLSILLENESTIRMLNKKFATQHVSTTNGSDFGSPKDVVTSKIKTEDHVRTTKLDISMVC